MIKIIYYLFCLFFFLCWFLFYFIYWLISCLVTPNHKFSPSHIWLFPSEQKTYFVFSTNKKRQTATIHLANSKPLTLCLLVVGSTQLHKKKNSDFLAFCLITSLYCFRWGVENILARIFSQTPAQKSLSFWLQVFLSQLWSL